MYSIHIVGQTVWVKLGNIVSIEYHDQVEEKFQAAGGGSWLKWRATHNKTTHDDHATWKDYVVKMDMNDHAGKCSVVTGDSLSSAKYYCVVNFKSTVTLIKVTLPCGKI